MDCTRVPSVSGPCVWQMQKSIPCRMMGHGHAHKAVQKEGYGRAAGKACGRSQWRWNSALPPSNTLNLWPLMCFLMATAAIHPSVAESTTCS